MTIFVTWQLRVTLDNICNSCNVFWCKCTKHAQLQIFQTQFWQIFSTLNHQRIAEKGNTTDLQIQTGIHPQTPGILYLWLALPIFLLTFSFNTWAVVVIKKKEQNGMNQMIICDYVAKIFCNGLIFLIYGSPFSIHGSHIVARIICGFRSVLTSLLFGTVGKKEIFHPRTHICVPKCIFLAHNFFYKLPYISKLSGSCLPNISKFLLLSFA